MARGELLLELLSEEIPARMQRRGRQGLIEQLTEALRNEELEPDTVTGYVTPRRLTVIATGLPDKQSDFFEERRGPRVNAPEAARAGFARSAGIAVADLIERDGYFYAEIVRVGRPVIEVLPKAVLSAIEETTWPKSMRFPAAPFHWVRPINSIVCLFDGKIVPLSVGQIPVGRTTRGHRFLAPGEIAVDNAQDYVAKLEAASVVLDQDHRRDLIAADLDRLAQKDGVKVKPDPGLLDEVTGLAEFPVVLMGTIDDASMALPPEVLATAMRTHQKYFTCLKSDGSPAPRFLFVANNKTPDGGKTIVAGNERVLKARLADARFFWDQDQKTPLAARVSELEQLVFNDKLGERSSMRQKAARMADLATYFAETKYVPGVDPLDAGSAAELAKADLLTGMVGEFPELQGLMGRYYAQRDWSPTIANAIADHYKPLGPRDTCPVEPVTIAVALADKIDTLVAFFAVGERPTGSGDPYGLRRAALGVIRIILENKLHVPLMAAFLKATEALRLPMDHDLAVAADLLSFFAERLKVHLREAGVRHDLIAAAFEQVGVMGIARSGRYEDDLIRLLAKVNALKAFLATDDGTNLLTAYRRASNIVTIEERRDGWQYGQEFEVDLLGQDEEKSLANRLKVVGREVREFLDHEEFDNAMSSLATLRRPVDEFFDKVTVNTDEAVNLNGEKKSIRVNRLRLLTRIRNTMDQVADFSQIEG